ncbi:hypothetical protein GCM10011581_49960 [Saccharopolyspora subtropica]|uniref:Uncharacterized protein n=1 Tax=Saccharopolyspora thermophila TaxID=89367 RepID=A0A917NK82_9PSEU|nr:hypothetical protein GCM10011581_49960 [Saccharopolyspora subtropica]
MSSRQTGLTPTGLAGTPHTSVITLRDHRLCDAVGVFVAADQRIVEFTVDGSVEFVALDGGMDTGRDRRTTAGETRGVLYRSVTGRVSCTGEGSP